MDRAAQQNLLAELVPGATQTASLELTEQVTLTQHAYERHVAAAPGLAEPAAATAEPDRNVLVITSLSTDTGEGYHGEFDPDDPDDLLLYRFDIEIALPSEPTRRAFVDDASYCTQLPAAVPVEMRLRALAAIHHEAVNSLSGGASIKKAMEQMSWIGPSDFTTHAELHAAAQQAIADDRARPADQRG